MVHCPAAAQSFSSRAYHAEKFCATARFSKLTRDIAHVSSACQRGAKRPV